MLTKACGFATVIRMKYGLLDLVGNIGVVLLMMAYLLLQLNRLSSNGLTYSLINALGASLIVVSMVANFNLSAFVIEVFWIFISLLGIYRYFKNSPKILDAGN